MLNPFFRLLRIVLFLLRHPLADRVTFTLKSGRRITVYCTDWSIKTVGENLTSFKSPATVPYLPYMNLTEVAFMEVR